MFQLSNADFVTMFGLAVVGAILVGALSSSASPLRIALRAISIVAGAVVAVVAFEMLPAWL